MLKTNVADMSDFAKFKGNMTIWPVHKTNTDEDATNTKHELLFL